MASSHVKSNFELFDTIEALYTGGNVQLSNDGSRLFCTCGNIINEIDINTGKVVGVFKDDDDEVTNFAVSPDNETLITASRSLLLHKFNVNEKTVIDRWKMTHKTPVLSMAFDQTSTLLATGSSDSTVKVYDSMKKYCTHNFKGALSSVNLLKFHPEAEKLVLFSTYDDGKIRMWDLKTSKCLSVFEGHFSSVTSLIFSPDNLSMVSAGRDKVLIVWDLLQRKQLKTVPVYESIEGLCILPNKDDKQDHFVSVGESGYLRKWNLSDVKCVYADPKYIEASQGTGSSSSTITHVLYSSSTNQFVSITYDHNIVFYDVTSLKPQKQFIGYYDEIVDIKLFGPGQEYIAIATNSEQIKIVNYKSSTSEIICAHTGTVLSLDVSYDGKYIAASSKDNTISIWCKDADDIQFCCVAMGKGHTHHVGGVTWPKTSTDYVVSCSKDLTVKCWVLPQLLVKANTVDLQVKWTEKGHDKDINVVSVSPNDKLLVSASQDKTAKLWKMKSGKLVGVLRGHKRGIWCAEFSPVDQCIATGSVDGTIKLWALSNLTCVKTFEGHTNSVLRVYFINRGMQLISSGSEGLIKVWNIRNDECVATIEGHDEKVWAMAVSKDEQTVVTGAADSAIKFWRDITEETIIQQEKEEEKKIQKEQEMMNLIHAKKFDKAVGLAIMLNHPHRALKVFKLILAESTGQNILQDVISKLTDNYLENLLEYLCAWNTNARNSFITQSILSIVLRNRSPDELLGLSKIKEVIESLLPYTERHYDRVKRLVHQSMFVNYSWESMKLPTLELERESIIEDSFAIE